MYKKITPRKLLFAANMMPFLWYVINSSNLNMDHQIVFWALVCATLMSCLPNKHISKGILISILNIPFILIWMGTLSITGLPPSPNFLITALNSNTYEIKNTLLLISHNYNLGFFFALYIIAIFFSAMKNKHESVDKSMASFLFGMALILFSTINITSKLCINPILAVRSSVPLLYEMDLLKESIRLFINHDTLNRIDAGVYTRNANEAPKAYLARKEIAIFVIGESLRADSLININRGKYSKILQNRLNSGLGIRMPNACSYSNATFISVPRLVTASEVNDTNNAEHAPTILAYAKSAGYKTAYISNHPDLVFKEDSHYTIDVATIDGPSYDDEVINNLAAFIHGNQNDAIASILHIYGQHYPYIDRYPNNADKENTLSSSDIEEVNYQNAAEYGVKVLLELASILDKSPIPAYVVFTSDHGENLASDHTGKKYHAGPTVGKNDTTVPFLILWNKSFSERNWIHDIYPLINKNGLVAHKDIANAWLTLSGWREKLTMTDNPQTLGSKISGQPFGPVKCSDLLP
jgi:glucan phosphoethanolaminetransferase (alkaline phosphatase superfamily)